MTQHSNSEPDADLIKQALADFNGGLVHIADTANPRGFVTRYDPEAAMGKALKQALEVLAARACG